MQEQKIRYAQGLGGILFLQEQKIRYAQGWAPLCNRELKLHHYMDVVGRAKQEPEPRSKKQGMPLVATDYLLVSPQKIMIDASAHKGADHSRAGSR